MQLEALELVEGVTLGADPELFIVDEKGDFVCPDEIVPGTKDFPHKVDHGALQQDGFAAELNIDPVNNYKDWERNIKAVTEQLEDVLPEGHSLACVPTATFSRQVWDGARASTKRLGCSPDFNAWARKINRAPDNIPFVRHAGGHIHFGWTEWADTSDLAYVDACVDLARQLDWTLGLWSLSLDDDTTRREMYGKAGSMRFKPYGMEYRTLSNFWLDTEKDPDILLKTWNKVCMSLNDMSENFYPNKYNLANTSVVRAIDGQSPELFEEDMKYILDFAPSVVEKYSDA